MLLLAFSVIFHFHFAGAAGVAPIALLGLCVYMAGLSANRRICAGGVVLCVAALLFYKYSHFLISQLEPILGGAVVGSLQESVSLVLPETPPLAISFFVFEFIHYLLDVRKGGWSIKNPFDFLHFALFFPTLVAGPVKRYQTFLPALREGVSTVAASDFAFGLMQVLLGSFKKSVLADNMSSFIDWSQDRLWIMAWYEKWNLLLMIALRIYFDFSGYSDIAIGLARMLGIKLPPNFNMPYLANNLVDFWRRWHISLSTWIRDYIYLSLGGSRVSLKRRILNGIIAFLLCGLWHGASWNFILWGIYHGAGLGLCVGYRRVAWLAGLGGVMDRFPGLSWLVTFLFVCFGWLLFFYEPGRAWQFFLSLWGL